MTTRSIAVQAQRLTLLEGQVCCQALVVMQGVSLDFGHLSPPDDRGHRYGDLTLGADSPWRLEDEVTVLAGSGDENVEAERRLKVLAGKRLLATETFLPSFTLTLRFDGGLRLWLFPDAWGWFADEAEWTSPWYIIGPGLPNEREEETE